ncbi:MAG: primase C-terminal domain-containing protein, partial [Janthinobacterium lividum]
KRATEATGLGRNVHLFDGLRTWAYRARYRYDDRLEWEQTVLAVALGINVEFAVPLPSAEVAATAQSVARWVWRKLSREGLVVVQTIRGRRRAAQPSAAEARARGAVKGGQTAGRMSTPAQLEARRRNVAKATEAASLARKAKRAAIREGVL